MDWIHINLRDLKKYIWNELLLPISGTFPGPWALGGMDRLVYISLANDACSPWDPRARFYYIGRAFWIRMRDHSEFH